MCFNCCFFCCLQLQDQGGVPVCEDTPAPAAAQALHTGFLHCHVQSLLSSLCGVTNHKMFVPKTRGSACLVCSVKGSATQEGHRQGERAGCPASVEVCRYSGDEKPKMTLEAGSRKGGVLGDVFQDFCRQTLKGTDRNLCLTDTGVEREKT